MSAARDKAGFTLMEVMIVAALLSVVGLLAFMAVQSAVSATEVAEAQGTAQVNVAQLVQIMTRELQLASTRADDSLSPPLEPAVLRNNPAPGVPLELEFQVPTDNTGRNWSTRIRYRYINEDANGNGRLDGGEDLNEDGLLNRRIVRMEDRNGDGDADDNDEQVPVAGANNVANATFALNGNVLTITLVTDARVRRFGRPSNTLTSSITSQVCLMN